MKVEGSISFDLTREIFIFFKCVTNNDRIMNIIRYWFFEKKFMLLSTYIFSDSLLVGKKTLFKIWGGVLAYLTESFGAKVPSREACKIMHFFLCSIKTGWSEFSSLIDSKV